MDRSARRDPVELFSVHCHAGHSSHGGHVQNQDHERRVTHALPLAGEAAPGSRLEPEARVVLRMSDDDNERTAALAEDVQASPHQL